MKRLLELLLAPFRFLANAASESPGQPSTSRIAYLSVVWTVCAIALALTWGYITKRVADIPLAFVSILGGLGTLLGGIKLLQYGKEPENQDTQGKLNL